MSASAALDALLASAQSRYLERASTGQVAMLGDVIADLENGWSPACLPHPAEGDAWGVIRLGAVSFGEYDASENKQLPATLMPRPQYEIKSGDVLISRANTSELVGSCVQVRNTPSRLMLCDKVFRVHFRPDSPIRPGYLNVVLKTPELRRQIVSAASGTSPTMQNISKPSLMRLVLPLPSVDDQEEFVRAVHGLRRGVTAARDGLHEADLERVMLVQAALREAFRVF